ncbi:uncharacterized protein DUF397 [Tamaricihabitans halophyticus]|uniref:Uncharacterized protein DUF397 n=1 Tax=Tamaricihabitans halophyticus TaxID=1262583 RepID=A0A4R2QXV8_9PSEU|nr:DUF397 domain-containing protein [Tamaricihabitans halophyticus]TCP51985.1 uncharacterized protein DUF397 [Tamaricihabitans halophyticus]
MINADFSAAQWRKSSYSGSSGDCVEVAFAPATWRTSSYSGSSGNCVEVAVADSAVGVRDSKNPTAGTLIFPATSWAEFLHARH